MPILDMRTMFTAYLLSTVVNSIVLGSLWWQSRRRSPETALWFADTVLQCAGLALILTRPQAPDFISMVVSNALIIGGGILLFVGLERYVGKTSPVWPHYALMAAFLLFQSYFTLVTPDLTVRTTIIALGLLVISARSAWLLLHRAERGLRWATAPAGIVLAGIAITSIAHAAASVAGPRTSDFFGSGVEDTIVMLSYMLLNTGLTFALLLMVSRRLQADLEADIAERERAEQAAKRSERKFAVAFQTVPDGIMISRVNDGLIVEVNDSWCRMLGYARDEVVGHTTLDLHIWDGPADRTTFVTELAEYGRVADFEMVTHTSTGTTFPSIVYSELVEVEGEQMMLSVVRDATERKLAEEHLRELSQRDALTGLLNHRAFYAEAQARMSDTGEMSAALVYIDLDGLKSINDGFGHPMGDQAIVAFADVLRSSFREADVIGRLGGDEFAILAFGRDPVSDEVLLARFLDQLRAMNASSRLPFQISGSIGVSWWEPSSGPPDLEALIVSGDARMYEAKRVRYRAAAAKEPGPV